MSDNALPNVLYHYTTQDGLLGILNQKALWATKIHFLNDSSELIAPLEDAKRTLSSRLKSSKTDVEKEIILRMLDQIDGWRDVNLCVCSFCEEGDQLSQWRAYGNPGSAYSIGFNPTKLMEDAPKRFFDLNQCQYLTPEEQRDVISEYIDLSIEDAKSKGFAQDFISALLRMASIIKNKAFKEEKEWRLVTVQPLIFTDDNFNFRPGKSMIIPYYSLPIDLSCITEIIIGPSPHPALAQDAVGGLIHKYQLGLLENWSIRLSKIPYRNW